MVKTDLKDEYIGVTSTTEIQNEVSKWCQINNDKGTQFMVNKLVNEFYTRFLFWIDALPQDVVFPLDIEITFFNNLSPDVRELFISEGIQVTPRLLTQTNHQCN